MNKEALDFLAEIQGHSSFLKEQYTADPILQAVPGIAAAYLTLTTNQDPEAAQEINLASTDQVYLKELRKHMVWILSFAAANSTNCPHFIQNDAVKQKFVAFYKCIFQYCHQKRENDFLLNKIKRQVSRSGKLADIARNFNINPRMFTAPEEKWPAILGTHPISTITAFFYSLVGGPIALVCLVDYIEKSNNPNKQGNPSVEESLEGAVVMGTTSVVALLYAFRIPIRYGLSCVSSTIGTGVNKLCAPFYQQRLTTEMEQQLTATSSRDSISSTIR